MSNFKYGQRKSEFSIKVFGRGGNLFMRKKMLKCLIDNHTTRSFPDAPIDTNDFGLVACEVMVSKGDEDAIVEAKKVLFHCATEKSKDRYLLERLGICKKKARGKQKYKNYLQSDFFFV
jgi:hypothetical protein